VDIAVGLPAAHVGDCTYAELEVATPRRRLCSATRCQHVDLFFSISVHTLSKSTLCFGVLASSLLRGHDGVQQSCGIKRRILFVELIRLTPPRYEIRETAGTFDVATPQVYVGILMVWPCPCSAVLCRMQAQQSP
jgi:hypothetical protein